MDPQDDDDHNDDLHPEEFDTMPSDLETAAARWNEQITAEAIDAVRDAHIAVTEAQAQLDTAIVHARHWPSQVTDRDLAAILGVTREAVHKRRATILARIEEQRVETGERWQCAHCQGQESFTESVQRSA